MVQAKELFALANRAGTTPRLSGVGVVCLSQLSPGCAWLFGVPPGRVAMTYGMRAPAMSLKESNTYWLGACSAESPLVSADRRRRRPGCERAGQEAYGCRKTERARVADANRPRSCSCV